MTSSCGPQISSSCSVCSERYRITADLVKPGAAVFDVATRVGTNGKLQGDVDFERVKDIASFITPVPKEWAQ